MVRLKKCMACGGKIEHYLEEDQVVVECRGECPDYQMMRCNLDTYDPEIVKELLIGALKPINKRNYAQ